MILRYGQYKGRNLRDVPGEYLAFLHEESNKTSAACAEELQRREQAEEAKMPMIERVVAAGFHTLARKLHPDLGGSTVGMQELNAAHEALREMLRSSQAASVER